MTDTLPAYRVLQTTLELPCGAVLQNRLAKAAMSDSLGDGEGNPTAAQIRLYERWAEGGSALSFIGEVQGDPRYPEKPGNLVLDAQSDDSLLKTFTGRVVGQGHHLWPQLGHAGALAHGPVSVPKGPSPIDVEGLQCAGLTLDEIRQLPDIYARAASHAKSVGFSGVHLHAGHGFLLSQFLSPLFNQRGDQYGGSIEGRSRIVLEIISSVRAAVGPTFPVGIRINASDLLEGGLTEDDALEVVRRLNGTSIDLIDISGGTYFPGARASSDGVAGDPYFMDFALRARAVTGIPLMLTGGFKKRDQAIQAITSGAADIVGLARAMALDPALPNAWMTEQGGDPGFPRFDVAPPGGMTAWYTLRLTALAEDREDAFDLDLTTAIETYENRDDERCARWRRRFFG